MFYFICFSQNCCFTLDRFCHFHNLSFSLSLKIQRTNYTLISLSHHNCAVADTSFDLCKICNVSSYGPFFFFFKSRPGGISPLPWNIGNISMVDEGELFPLQYLLWWTKGSFALCKIRSALYILGLSFSKEGLKGSLLFPGIS